MTEVRPVVTVEAELCNYCGSCITECPQAALEFVAGRARLVNEALCAGDGICVDYCGGALKLEVRQAAPFDPVAVERRREKRARLRALAGED